MTQDEAKQIADVVRGFGVEVDMQSVQLKEELEQAYQSKRTPIQKAQAEAEHRALSENIAYVVIEWSESNSSALRNNMEEAIPDKEQRKEYVERNNERKTINKIRRKVRLAKKLLCNADVQ